MPSRSRIDVRLRPPHLEVRVISVRHKMDNQVVVRSCRYPRNVHAIGGAIEGLVKPLLDGLLNSELVMGGPSRVVYQPNGILCHGMPPTSQGTLQYGFGVGAEALCVIHSKCTLSALPLSLVPLL